MKKLSSFILFLLCFPFTGYGGELDIGGEITAVSIISLNQERLSDAEFEGKVIFTPLFIAEGGGVLFTAEPELVLDSAKNTGEISLKNFSLETMLFDFIQMKGGRYIHLPGKGLLSPITNYFHQIDYEQFFSGSLENIYAPGYLAEIAVFPGSFYFRTLVSIFPRTPSIPDPESQWFPWARIPEDLTIEYEGETIDMILMDVEIDDSETADPLLKNISLSAEIGGAVSLFDFSAHYYHGIDNTLILRSRLDFPSGILQFYDLILSPKITTVDAFGCNFELLSGGFQFWTTASFVPWKTLATTEFSELTQTNGFEQTRYLEYAGGAGYTFRYPSIFIAAEAQHAHAFTSETAIIMPYYYSLAGGIITADFFSGDLTAGAVYLFSLSDNSSAAVLSLTYSPVLEFKARISIPVFFGKERSDFGMYKNNHTAGLTFSFFF